MVKSIKKVVKARPTRERRKIIVVGVLVLFYHLHFPYKRQLSSFTLGKMTADIAFVATNA